MSNSYFLNYISLTVVLVLCSFAGNSQTLKYSIYRGSSEIGQIVASREKSQHVCRYDVTSFASFRVILKYERKTSMKVSYRHNILETGESTTYMNGELEESSRTRRWRNAYIGVTLEGDTLHLPHPITYSSAMLYFQEPVGIHQVYAESYLALCPIEPAGKSRYKLTLPGGKINYYTYKAGVLTEVLVERSWFNLHFRLED